jgi:M6 family metalloprotease-like protein
MSRLTFAALSLAAYCAFAGLSSLVAAPPRPGELERYKQDGSFQRRVDYYESTGNHRYDPELAKRAQAKIRRAALEADGVPQAKIDQIAPIPPIGGGMPTTGDVKIPAILIEFSDIQAPAGNTNAFIDAGLFGDGDPANYPVESLHNYYERASNGKLNLQGTTLGWYRTTYPRDQVPQTDAGREGLIKEAVTSFDASHDFAQYDHDNDGDIDYLLVIYAGPDTGWGNFWWAYQFPFFLDQNFKVDGKRIVRYVFQFTDYGGAPFKPLVSIHESGHALGLPDLYDYDDTVGPKGEVGGMDMMSANMGNHNGYDRWILDWITPTVIGSGVKEIKFRPSGTSPDGVAVIKGASEDNPFDEMFFVENRRKAGNDDDPRWPGDGLMIWHVDGTLNPAGTGLLYDQHTTEHKFLRVMEADGLEQIEQDLGGDSGDFWKPGQTFDVNSTPNSRRYDGTDSAVEVKNIRVVGNDILAFVAAGDPAPEILTASVDKSGRKLTILYSETVVNVRPPTLNFSAGPIKARYSKGNNTSAIEYRLSRQAFRSEDATLDLTSGSVVDISGNGNAFIQDVPVVIGVEPDATPPVVKSAVINANGNTLTLTFDENVDFVEPPVLALTGGTCRAKFKSGDGTSSFRFDLSRTVGAKEKGVYDFVRGSATNEIGLPNRPVSRGVLKNESDVKNDSGDGTSSEVRRLGKFANYYVDLAYDTASGFYNDGGGYTGNAYYAYVYSYFALYYRYSAGDIVRWGGKTKKTRGKALANYFELRSYQAQMSSYALAYSQQDYAMTGSATSLYAYYYSYYANAYAQQDLSEK